MYCAVDVVDPAMAISPSQAAGATTISDLNPYYKASWVKSYTSVVIETTYRGDTRRAQGINDTLSAEQKKLISNIDDGTSIQVDIHYIPNNNLRHNEEKVLQYKIPIYPKIDAEYPGGKEALMAYLSTHIINQIDSTKVKEHQQYSVQFIIDEGGHVVDPVMQFASEDEQLDSLLLRSVCNMPRWTPARYQSGQPTAQRHALVLGDRYSCTENLINARSTVTARIAKMKAEESE